jgi:hypothetical protein
MYAYHRHNRTTVHHLLLFMLKIHSCVSLVHKSPLKFNGEWSLLYLHPSPSSFLFLCQFRIFISFPPLSFLSSLLWYSLLFCFPFLYYNFLCSLVTRRLGFPRYFYKLVTSFWQTKQTDCFFKQTKINFILIVVTFVTSITNITRLFICFFFFPIRVNWKPNINAIHFFYKGFLNSEYSPIYFTCPVSADCAVDQSSPKHGNVDQSSNIHERM